MKRQRSRNGEPLEFFLETIITAQKDHCVLWPYAKQSKGYGAINIRGKLHLVHVMMCERVYGPKSDSSLEAAHSCGNRICINPFHIRWATSLENSEDMIAHGTKQYGENTSGAKLTEIQAVEVHELYLHGMLQKEIAEKFGVQQSAISRILSGKRWPHLLKRIS